MFRRQPLVCAILMCSTFYSLNSPDLRCRGNAGGRWTFRLDTFRRKPVYSIVMRACCRNGKAAKLRLWQKFRPEPELRRFYGDQTNRRASGGRDHGKQK